MFSPSPPRKIIIDQSFRFCDAKPLPPATTDPAGLGAAYIEQMENWAVSCESKLGKTWEGIDNFNADPAPVKEE